jgi:hypothetical protein
MATKYPDIDVQLSGEDGNAMSIIARVRKALRRADVPDEEINKFSEEAMSGDYDNVLQTAMRWVNVG